MYVGSHRECLQNEVGSMKFYTVLGKPEEERSRPKPHLLDAKLEKNTRKSRSTESRNSRALVPAHT